MLKIGYLWIVVQFAFRVNIIWMTKFSGNAVHTSSFLAHYYLEILKRVICKLADPDQMSHNVASDQGLHCC